MIPPVFTLLYADAAVKALLGSAPMRVFPWGQAPETVARPYATYIVFDGSPENMIGDLPDMDVLRTQIDVWAESSGGCNTVAKAVRKALESAAHVSSFSSSAPDTETKLFRQRLDFDFFQQR